MHPAWMNDCGRGGIDPKRAVGHHRLRQLYRLERAVQAGATFLTKRTAADTDMTAIEQTLLGSAEVLQANSSRSASSTIER